LKDLKKLPKTNMQEDKYLLRNKSKFKCSP